MIFWLAVFSAGLPAPASAQQGMEKKMLEEKDYPKWHNLSASGLSQDARWASYSLSYDFRGDTLFVKNTLDGRKFVFPKGRQGRFVSKDIYACGQNGSLILTQLESGRRTEGPKVSAFQTVGGGAFLFAEQDAGTAKRIMLLELDGTVLWSADGVAQYSLNYALDGVAYAVERNGVHEIRFARFGRHVKDAPVISSSELPLLDIAWRPGGNSLAFAAVGTAPDGSRTTERIYYCDLDSGRTRQIAKGDPAIPKGMVLSPIYMDYFHVADDGRRVFIGLERIAGVPAQDTGIQIWNTLDKKVFSLEQVSPTGSGIIIAAWDTKDGTVREIDAGSGKIAILTGDQQNALLFDWMQYQPSIVKSPPRDIYIRNLESGAEELLLKHFTGSDECLAVSPAGKYVAYFLEGHWWLYDISQHRHIKASRKEDGSLEAPDNDFPTPALPSGPAMFTPGDRSLLYYGIYDIYEFEPATGARVRHTDGSKIDVEFRFAKADSEGSYQFQKAATVDIGRPQGLAARKLDNTAGGFYLLSKKKAAKLVFGEKKYSRLMLSADRKAFAFISERYDSPKTLEISSIAGGKELGVVHRSNAQQDGYAWGRAELIRYSDRNGKELSGVLYYPHGYDSTRKYPMVVHIYQKQSARLHSYVNPLLHNQTGFNPTLLGAAGYFVLLPDVHLETGNVGMSALDGVRAAVQKAVEVAHVDRSRIGLMGASFGGYETCFIISQTDIFRAAVAGSSMTDFISAYFSINGNERRTEDQRYETEQPRMRSTPFENWEGYVANSPLRHAQSIEAPLLLWTGTKDGQVDPTQSMELHLALRKLGKESVMVLYEGENHAMASTANQADLTRRVMEWFGWLLKGGAKPSWAAPRN